MRRSTAWRKYFYLQIICVVCCRCVLKSVKRQVRVSVDGWGQQEPFSPALSLKVAGLPQQVGWGCKGLTQACSRASSDQKFSRKNYSMEEWRTTPDTAFGNIWFLFPQHICFHLVSFTMYCELCALFSQRLAWLGLIAKADQLTKKLSKVDIEKSAMSLMKAQCCKEGLPKPLLWIFWNQVSAATTFSYPFPPLQIIINSVIRTLNPLQLWHDPGSEFRVVVSHHPLMR